MFNLFRKKRDNIPSYYFPFSESAKLIKVHAPITQKEAKKIADAINNNPKLLIGHPCAKLVNHRE